METFTSMLKIFYKQQYDYLNSLESSRSLFVWINRQNKKLTEKTLCSFQKMITKNLNTLIKWTINMTDYPEENYSCSEFEQLAKWQLHSAKDLDVINFIASFCSNISI